MCKPVIVKERRKNAKKLNMKNVLNDQKSKIFHTQSKLQGEVFKFSTFWLFILIGKGPNSS